MLLAFLVLVRMGIEVGTGLVNCYWARGKPEQFTTSPRAPLNYLRLRMCFSETQLTSSEKLYFYFFLIKIQHLCRNQAVRSVGAKSGGIYVFSQCHATLHRCLSLHPGATLPQEGSSFRNPTVSCLVTVPYTYTDF